MVQKEQMGGTWGFLFETLIVDYKKEVRNVIMYMYEPAHLSRHRSEMYSPVKAKIQKKKLQCKHSSWL